MGGDPDWVTIHEVVERTVGQAEARLSAQIGKVETKLDGALEVLTGQRLRWAKAYGVGAAIAALVSFGVISLTPVPQGPAGAAGPSGTQGPAGPQGSPGQVLAPELVVPPESTPARTTPSSATTAATTSTTPSPAATSTTQPCALSPLGICAPITTPGGTP